MKGAKRTVDFGFSVFSKLVLRICFYNLNTINWNIFSCVINKLYNSISLHIKFEFLLFSLIDYGIYILQSISRLIPTPIFTPDFRV